VIRSHGTVNKKSLTEPKKGRGEGTKGMFIFIFNILECPEKIEQHETIIESRQKPMAICTDASMGRRA